MEVVITKSKKPGKKFDARIDCTKTVSFGEKGASDYTKHKDKDRKIDIQTDIKHIENWNVSGAKAAGFYSRWVTWNKPTLKASIDDISKKFKNPNVKMKQK